MIRFFIVLIFIFLRTVIYSQSVCQSQSVMYNANIDLCSNDAWVKVFEDNFEGSSLDLSKWTIFTGVPRDQTFLLQKAWHKADNITVSNGTLKIISKKEFLPNMPIFNTDFDYSTGEIWTKYKFEFGKFEARIKIPKGKGFFPAFWLWGGEPRYNEIDIFEFLDNNTSEHLMTVHFDNGGGRKQCLIKESSIDFSQDFHIFGLEWEKHEIRFYVDGVLKRTDARHHTTLGQNVGCNIWAGTQYEENIIYPIHPMYIILNTAIQNGKWTPDITTPFPSNLEVDWVRYYKRVPCKDVNITDASQFTLSSQVYNVIVGNDVSMSNFTVPSDRQLHIIANKSIALQNTFTSQAGSNFTTEINPNILCTKIAGSSGRSLSESTASEIEDIIVYPNPNNGKFNIDFERSNFVDYQLDVLDYMGRSIYSIEQINTRKLEIDMGLNFKGFHILRLLNTKTKQSFTKKLLIN